MTLVCTRKFWRQNFWPFSKKFNETEYLGRCKSKVDKPAIAIWIFEKNVESPTPLSPTFCWALCVIHEWTLLMYPCKHPIVPASWNHEGCLQGWGWIISSSYPFSPIQQESAEWEKFQPYPTRFSHNTHSSDMPCYMYMGNMPNCTNIFFTLVRYIKR